MESSSQENSKYESQTEAAGAPPQVSPMNVMIVMTLMLMLRLSPVGVPRNSGEAMRSTFHVGCHLLPVLLYIEGYYSGLFA
ncbi:unnamed protein product [Echinostoma caproni]|uniref:Ovule protein n=1 Tax=Echinostoma caproni TaxID=27848 RepID=A0A182ZZ84_9TREM|nr:unnamed protein product [Echinostoma caproni]